jgi:hypothetical protein
MDAISGLTGFFIGGWGSSFAAYVAVQAIALATLKRSFRFWAMLPIPFMLVLAFITFSAYSHDSNMWPLLMIFLSPIALLYVVGLELVGLGVQAHPSGTTLAVVTVGILAAACLPYVYIFLVAT